MNQIANMQPTTGGQIVRFLCPLPDENPGALYVTCNTPEKGRVDITSLDFIGKWTITPMQTVLVSDLVTVETNDGSKFPRV